MFVEEIAPNAILNNLLERIIVQFRRNDSCIYDMAGFILSVFGYGAAGVGFRQCWCLHRAKIARY